MKKPLRVMGFDPPTGWALLEQDGAKWRWLNGGSGITKPDYFILGIPAGWNIDLIAIEWVKKVVPRRGFGPGMATELSNASGKRGEMKGTAIGRGFDVIEVQAEEWRKNLCGDSKANNALIKMVIQARVVDLPRLTNDHERDACGVAIFGAMKKALQPKPVIRMKPRPRKSIDDIEREVEDRGRSGLY